MFVVDRRRRPRRDAAASSNDAARPIEGGIFGAQSDGSKAAVSHVSREQIETACRNAPLASAYSPVGKSVASTRRRAGRVRRHGTTTRSIRSTDARPRAAVVRRQIGNRGRAGGRVSANARSFRNVRVAETGRPRRATSERRSRASVRPAEGPRREADRGTRPFDSSGEGVVVPRSG